MNKPRRFPISVKIDLVIILAVLVVSVGLTWASYRIYCKKINELYFDQVTRASSAANGMIIPEFVQNLWLHINTDEFRDIHLKADAANDESIIREWMKTKPSAFDSFFVSAEENTENTGADSEESTIAVVNYPEVDNLYSDYEVLLRTLSNVTKLFDVSDVYIQYEENGQTYNLADPLENLLYIGSIEAPIKALENYSDNEAIPPTVYQSVYGYLCSTALPIKSSGGDTIVGLIGVDVDMERVIEAQHRFLFQSALYIFTLIIITIVGTMSLLKKVITGPLKMLSKAATGFAMDGQGLSKEDVIDLPIHTNDEISDLYHAIQAMQERIVDYTDNLTKITKERERTKSELYMARNIQKAMIPNTFPAFPDREDFDLYAMMTPAKVVGGDFYDYFLVDNDHVAVVIADVSDKSVPAALFMMSSMILINYRAHQGGHPGQILADVNAQICRSNKSKMFVTVWLGILDLNTGIMECSNAGHEYPFIRSKDGIFRMLRDKHGLVIGAFGNSVYTDYELKLEPGSAVFVYTDGVSEASNSAGEFFGMKRIEEALKRSGTEDPQLVLENMNADLGSFVGDAPQYDDITMLCIEYRGRKS